MQIMSDASRLVRPEAVTQWSAAKTAAFLYRQVAQAVSEGSQDYLLVCGPRVLPIVRRLCSLGLSRAKGNFHARFLGGCEREPLAPTRQKQIQSCFKIYATAVNNWVDGQQIRHTLLSRRTGNASRAEVAGKCFCHRRFVARADGRSKL
jgi:hypothetical protein